MERVTVEPGGMDTLVTLSLYPGCLSMRGWVMGESGILAGLVADGAGSVSIQTAAPAGVEVMSSLPGKSDGTGVSGAAGAMVPPGMGVVLVRKTAGIDSGTMTAAATRPAVRRQQRRRRVRVSIDEGLRE
jgi:hypothetical protein